MESNYQIPSSLSSDVSLPVDDCEYLIHSLSEHLHLFTNYPMSEHLHLFILLMCTLLPCGGVIHSACRMVRESRNAWATVWAAGVGTLTGKTRPRFGSREQQTLHVHILAPHNEDGI